MRTKITLLSVLFLLAAFFQPAKAIVFTVEVPEGTNECYMIGVADDWANFKKMTRVGSENKFTLDMPELTVDDMTNADGSPKGYSYCSGPDWAYEEINVEGKGVVHFWQEGVANVVGTWKEIYNLNAPLTYTVNVPDGTKVCYMVGDATGDWNIFLPMERVGTSNKFTLTINGASKEGWNTYAAGPGWEYQEVNDQNKSVARQWEAEHTVLHWENISTGTNNVENQHFSIKIVDNKITVEEIFGTVNLFSMTGQCVQQKVVNGKFVSKYLGKGVYVLQNGAVSSKVIVR